MSSCLFCEVITSSRNIADSNFCFAIEDGYPVTPGHTLIIPKRCIDDFALLTNEELIDAWELVRWRKAQLIQRDPSINGFNLGINFGKSSGQTVGHCHIHLIPRRSGDTDDPTGGVRGVIPAKANYKQSR